jgi:hypothetical protein
VFLAIFSIKRELDAGVFPYSTVHSVQPAKNVLQRDRFEQSKIEVL